MSQIGSPATAAPHDLGGAQHIGDTLVDLNTKVTDATLDDIGDPRTDNDAIHDNVAAEISAVTEKVTPVSADLVIIEDSAAANAKKRVQVGNLPSAGGDVVNTVTTTTATETTIATISIADDTVVLIEASVVGRRTNAADRGGFIRRALAYREGGGGATRQGSVNTDFTRRSDGDWDVTIDVSGNDARIRVTGVAGHTINWKSRHIELGVS